jgi:hypothetical protein
MASLKRQNVHNADLRVTAPQTTDSHVIVIVSFDQSAAGPALCSASSNVTLAAIRVTARQS